MFKNLILLGLIAYALAAPFEQETIEDLDVDVLDIEGEPIKFEIDIDEVFLDKVKRSAEPGQRSTTESSFCRGRNAWC